jgi:hypothetical protein
VLRSKIIVGLAMTTALAGGTGIATADTPEQSAKQAVNWSATSASRTPGSYTSQSIQEGPVRILSRYGSGNQCLDADLNGGGNGTKVQVWQCNGSLQQRWYLWNDGSLENYAFPGKCLDADFNGGGRNGTRVQLWDCNGTPQQHWSHPVGDLAIYNQAFYNNGNTVLERDANVPGDGAPVQLWTKNFLPQQWWDIWAD